MSVIAAALLLLVQALPPLVGPLVPETGGRVTGIVRRSDTGQPIPGAQVGLAAPGASLDAAMARAVSTDVNGRFTIKSISSGAYTLIAQADGYFSVTSDPTASPQVKRDVGIIDGQQTDVGSIELAPAGAVSGRISGPDGRPVIGAVVQAWRAAYVRGRLTFSVVKATPTDDLGEYRLFWLSPGDYYISSQYQGGAGATLDRYARVFFPGVLEEDLAPSIAVRGAQELSGIDLQISVTPIMGITMTGRVVVEDEKQPTLRIASLELVPRDRRVLLMNDASNTFANQASDPLGGNFELRDVPPGVYDLFTAFRDTSGALRSGRIPVDVANGRIEDVSVVIDPLFEVSGRVTLDDDVPGDRLKPDSIVMMVQDAIPGKESRRVLNPRAETGEFKLSGVAPGRYVLQLDGASRSSGMYVVGSGLVVDKDAHENLNIDLKSAGGTVFGNVLDVTRIRPFPYATVALVPERDRENYTLYRETTAERDGRFVFNGLPPGNYVVFAWQTVIPGAWQNPIFIARYETRGVPVVVETGAEKTVQVIAIP
jgi:protocatechuate 3,4-dioxygenase beta subunit